MAKGTGKGSKGSTRGKKEAAFTRHAAGHSMQQKTFIGEAEPERAEAEFVKHEQVEAARQNDVVHEMAEQLEQEAGVAKESAAAGEFRAPRSVREGVEMLGKFREPQVREQLREKARERLRTLPRPLQMAVSGVEFAGGLVMKPVTKSVRLIAEALKVPAALVRILTHREA